jgi:hypothetical protein
MHAKFQWVNMKGTDRLQDRGVDGRITLKWLLEVEGVSVGLDQWYSTFFPRIPRDTFPLNFVPPKLLVPNSSYTQLNLK